MDPVSQLLAKRELAAPRLLPFVVLAVVFHSAAAAGVYVATRIPSSRPPQLTTVSVKLVRPPAARTAPPRRREAATPAAQPTQAPPPTAVPTPPPASEEALPTAPPKVSDDAMPAPDSSATPAPTQAPADGGATGVARGLSLGSGDDREGPGIPADFQFTYYIERMLALIESRWYKPPSPPHTRARARFRILKDGRVEAIVLEESSGIPSFDRAVQRALYGSNPLPPLPPTYNKPSLTVHLTFSE
jgi:protein TonB